MIITQLFNYNSSKYAPKDDGRSDNIEIDKDFKKLFALAQGRIRFGPGTSGNDGENIFGQWVTFTTSTADTEVTVPHTCGCVPVGYLTTKINKGGVIYDSGTAWTSTNIYIKCSTATTIVTLFLLK
jgi:hypothetical protein